MQILREHLFKYPTYILGAVISAVASIGTMLYQPKLLQDILNAILKNNMDAIKTLSVWLIFLAVIGVISGIYNVYFAAKIAQNVTSDLRLRTYQKIQSFSFGNIEHFSSGSLVVRLINDMNQITNLLMSVFMQFLRMPLMFIGAFIMGVYTLPRLWWLEILMIILVILVSIFTFQKMGRLFGQVQIFMDKINTRAKETLQGMRVVKSFNQEANNSANFNQTSDELNKINLWIGYIFSASFPAFMLATYAAIALAIYLVGGSITSHPSDVAAISSYVTYLSLVMNAIIVIGMTATMVSRGLVSLERIKEVLDTKPDLTYVTDQDEDLKGSVEFKHVSFTYPDSKQETLHDISFKVAPGQKIGIVGKTGSGKSTLAQLIARLYDPSSGEIDLGGKNIKEVSQKTVTKTVSFVLQRAILFSGTINENLRQGKKTASQAEIEKAAQIAQAEEFISKYSDTFEHEVEERSANFSGGQKQRLSLARGVVGNPVVLILDDSTSALDAKSEKLVQEGLAKHLKGTTTFIIAEKLVSVKDADQILVLDDGHLSACGTHAELLKTSPVYQEIYQTQKAKERRSDLS